MIVVAVHFRAGCCCLFLAALVFAALRVPIYALAVFRFVVFLLSSEVCVDDDS